MSVSPVWSRTAEHQVITTLLKSTLEQVYSFVSKLPAQTFHNVFGLCYNCTSSVFEHLILLYDEEFLYISSCGLVALILASFADFIDKVDVANGLRFLG